MMLILEIHYFTDWLFISHLAILNVFYAENTFTFMGGIMCIIDNQILEVILLCKNYFI